MFKWIFGLALVASLAFCGMIDYSSQRKLAEYNAEIAAKRAELVPLKPMVDEVEAFQKKKDALQKRIDIINQLKQHQRGPTPALAKLADVDPNDVDSIAVVGENLVVNRR